MNIPNELRHLNVGDKVFFSSHSFFYYIIEQFTACGIVFKAYFRKGDQYVNDPTWSYNSVIKHIVHHKTISINSSEYIL
jgi:hypothetical protein